jgi:hypothetical protein
VDEELAGGAAARDVNLGLADTVLGEGVDLVDGELGCVSSGTMIKR